MFCLFDFFVEALDTSLKVHKMMSSLNVWQSLQVDHISELVLKKRKSQDEMFARGGNILPGTSGSRNSR